MTDSTADLPYGLMKEKGIELIPLHIILGDSSYPDDNSIKTTDLFAYADKHNTLPKTAAANEYQFAEAFGKWLGEGYDVIFIGISAKLSATVQNARNAREKFDPSRVSVIDSKSLSTGIGLQVLEASELAERGAGLDAVLRHRADVLDACDEGVMLKRLIKACAEKHGLAATFMAKPYAEWTGSGMHIHISLADEAGNNLFAADDPTQNELLTHSVGGLKAAMAESMLIFAPNANSYRRFRRNSYAPVSASWGINNRTVSLRIPAGAAKACHIEHRPSGADANPNQVLAAILAGIRTGITKKIEPGPMAEGAADNCDAPDLPTAWVNALDQFEQSGVVHEAFGLEFQDVYTKLKQTERINFERIVTSLDHLWYAQVA
jgi:hypothetical protein